MPARPRGCYVNHNGLQHTLLVGCAHPRSSLRLAGARSSPDRVEIAYTMLGDDPDAGHILVINRNRNVVFRR